MLIYDKKGEFHYSDIRGLDLDLACDHTKITTRGPQRLVHILLMQTFRPNKRQKTESREPKDPNYFRPFTGLRQSAEDQQ